MTETKSVASGSEESHNPFAAIMSKIKTPAVASPASTNVLAMDAKLVRKIVPELVVGLLDSSGEAHPGAIKYESDGTDGGIKGAVYVVRPFVKVTPPLAQFCLQNFGKGNRTSTEGTIKKYAAAQAAGKWTYVGNTAIFTTDEVGCLESLGSEMHNAAHTSKADLISGRTILMTFIFGIPKSERDKIDDNLNRSLKDIVSTRSEMKDIFAENSVIGGVVLVTKELAKKMHAAVSETFRIVDDVRNGLAAKSGGSRDKTEAANKLNVYLPVLGKAISLVIALDSKLPYIQTTGKSAGKSKASGGLTHRYSVSHLAAVLTLASTDLVEGELVWNDDVAEKIVEAYWLLGNELETDRTSPMVQLRQTIDRWSTASPSGGKINSDGSGQNIRFNCLKQALIDQVAGRELRSGKVFDVMTPTSGNDGSLNLGGIDDYVDPRIAAREADAEEIVEEFLTEEETDV